MVFWKKKVSYPNGDVNNDFNMVVSNKHFLNSSKGIQKRQIWKVRTHVLKHHDYLPKFWVDDAREGGCTDSFCGKMAKTSQQKEHDKAVWTQTVSLKILISQIFMC